MEATGMYKRLPNWVRLFICLVTIIVIAHIDYMTGLDMGVDLLYLLPVAVAAWYNGLIVGLIFSVIAGATVAILNIPALGFHPTYIWNTAMHFVSFLVTTILVSELQKSFKREWWFAHTDALTGASNKMSFSEVARMEIERSKRTHRPFSLAYIDLDNFKSVNDTHGHDRGDSVLKSFVIIVKASTRTMDTIARLGGDEFAVLLPEVDEDEAVDIVTRTARAFERLMKGENLPVTCSIGLVTFTSNCESVNNILRRADNLMYEVKKEGKNSIKHMSVSGKVEENNV